MKNYHELFSVFFFRSLVSDFGLKAGIITLWLFLKFRFYYLVQSQSINFLEGRLLSWCVFSSYHLPKV